MSFEPIVLRPEDPGYDLKFWPTVLGICPTIALVTLYLGTALGIGMLYWSCRKVGGQFHVSSENVHMIARYFPSILGTANVILFRQTVQEFIRMTPYVNMADQGDRPGIGAILDDVAKGGHLNIYVIPKRRGSAATVEMQVFFDIA